MVMVLEAQGDWKHFKPEDREKLRKFFDKLETDRLTRARVASRRNAPELIARCLTPMFPAVTLAQGRFVAPVRAWMPPGCRTPAPVPSHPARLSGDAGLSAEADRGSSPDIPPAAARAAHVPFATGRRRTRPAAVPSLRRAGRAGAGRASASAWVAPSA